MKNKQIDADILLVAGTINAKEGRGATRDELLTWVTIIGDARKESILYALDLMASAGITPSEAAAQLRAGRTIEEVCAAAEVEQPAGFGPDAEITFVPDDAFGLPLKSDGNLCRLCGGPALCGAACSSCLRDGLRADYGYIDTPDGGLRPPT